MRMRRASVVSSLLAVLALAFEPRVARAWDDFGHMEVAAAAWPRLAPATKKRIARLLRLNPSYQNWIVGARAADVDRVAFLRAGTWADAIKNDPQYSDDKASSPTAAQNVGYADHFKHGYWHYVDQPFSPDGTPVVQPEAVNAATQIPLLRAALASPATSDDVKSYDLVWLLHLVADIHQPLHCVSRYDAGTPKGDRGGNAVRIAGNAQPAICDDPRYCPYGPPNQLHIFIDTIAGSGYAWAPAEAAARRLPRPDPVAAKSLDVGVWIAEGLALSREKIYVAPIGDGPGPFSVTPAYQAEMARLGQARMALAGARLAHLLNDALGP
jgi:hypothetical protein